ncbi:MAG TPA: hypothetical protein VNH11_28735 [Pirellulales bacterium]|nr:hypothetical protein [Pirellulales bacterium]
MRRVVLHNWKPGFSKIGLNHLLRERAGFTLSGAKSTVDSLLEGKEVLLELDDDVADDFLDDIRQLGVEAQVVDRVA